MADRTGIGWTDATWPVVTGCTRVSPGCVNCYAERMTATRLRHLPRYAGLAAMTPHGPRWTGDLRENPEVLDWPRKWRKPRRIFVADMGDLFHEAVSERYIAEVLGVMADCPRHTFQVLTKRPGRMRCVLTALGCPANVWTGVSVESQCWTGRLRDLRSTPSRVRFLSAEPLLGPLNFGGPGGLAGIHWLVVGGESGPGHRPCEIEWIASIVRQCREAGLPVYVKQDSGQLPGRQGRIPDELWVKEWPA